MSSEINIKEHPFLSELIAQLRATDQFGHWTSTPNDELLTKKYVKTKEDLKKIPVIADIDEILVKEIRLIFQALATAFEKKTCQMANVVMEMSHEGFGRCVVICEGVVLTDKHFRDAHRFGYKSLENLAEEGEKMLRKAFESWEKYKAWSEAA